MPGCAQTDIYATWTDIHATQMDTYDLMSDKCITSLLLIKMLKAFIRVTIKSLHLLTYVFLLTLSQVHSDVPRQLDLLLGQLHMPLRQIDLPLRQLHMPLRQIHMPPGWIHIAPGWLHSAM